MVATLTFQAVTGTPDADGGDTMTFPVTVASAAGQERLAVFGLICSTTGTYTVSSVTIDGQTATQVVQVIGADDGSGARAVFQVYRAAGTAGTNINAILNASAAGADTLGGICSVWTLSDAGTVFASATSTADDPPLNVNTAAGGAALGGGFRYGATSTSTWTGLTERHDTQALFGDTVFTGADASNVSAETPRTVSIAYSGAMASGGDSGGAAAICFNPLAPTTTDGVGSAAATGATSAVGAAIAVLVPDADITDGGWLTDTGGTNLFAAIDETVASDADYIVSSDTDTDTCEIRLSDPSMTLARPFSVAYRYKRIGTDTPTLRVQLMEGATSRASWDVAVSNDTFTDGEQFLTAPEFAAITDFTDLRVRFTAIRPTADALTLEGDFSGDLTLEGDFSGSLLLEGS